MVSFPSFRKRGFQKAPIGAPCLGCGWVLLLLGLHAAPLELGKFYSKIEVINMVLLTELGVAVRVSVQFANFFLKVVARSRPPGEDPVRHPLKFGPKKRTLRIDNWPDFATLIHTRLATGNT